MARSDPYRNFRFRLEIDGLQTAGFSEVEALATTADVIEYREGPDPAHLRKLSGLTKYGAKYVVSDLNAKGNEVLIELLELANEGIERVS